MDSTQATEAFELELRRVLQHLYDPAELRRSPLLALLGVHERPDVLSGLRRILTEANEALKPGADVPLHAQAWRIYRVLTYRYVEQQSQREVAADLGLSVRQLRRLEHEAVRVLADQIWARHELDGSAPVPSPANGASPAAEDGTSDREQELAWLQKTFPSEATDVATMAQAVLRTIAPLIRSSVVQVSSQIPEDLPPVLGQPTAMRQALLNVLTAAVRAAPGGCVHIGARPVGSRVHVRVRATDGRATAQDVRAEVAESVSVSRQLIELSGGMLEVVDSHEGCALHVTLVLAAIEQVTVLVIDDNTDTLQLFRRYLSASRYRMIGTPDPEQALLLAQESPPQIIVLDVMLPNTDGWELLGRLRAHPLTCQTPVIVCTILPQEQLALALGAAAFLSKPISRPALLAALDRQMASSRAPS